MTHTDLIEMTSDCLTAILETEKDTLILVLFADIYDKKQFTEEERLFLMGVKSTSNATIEYIIRDTIEYIFGEDSSKEVSFELIEKSLDTAIRKICSQNFSSPEDEEDFELFRQVKKAIDAWKDKTKVTLDELMNTMFQTQQLQRESYGQAFI